MILIDGKKAAAELREELQQEVAELKTKYNKVPGLTVFSFGIWLQAKFMFVTKKNQQMK